MRQIDQMTPEQIEVLKLKGMLSIARLVDAWNEKCRAQFDQPDRDLATMHECFLQPLEKPARSSFPSILQSAEDERRIERNQQQNEELT